MTGQLFELTIHCRWYWCRHYWCCIVVASYLCWITVVWRWTCYVIIPTVYGVIIICLCVVIVVSVQAAIWSSPRKRGGCWFLFIFIWETQISKRLISSQHWFSISSLFLASFLQYSFSVLIVNILLNFILPLEWNERPVRQMRYNQYDWHINELCKRFNAI